MWEKVNNDTNMYQVNDKNDWLWSKHIDCLLQDCGNFIADVQQLVQYCTKPSKPLRYLRARFSTEISIIGTISVVQQCIHAFCQHWLRHIGLLFNTKPHPKMPTYCNIRNKPMRKRVNQNTCQHLSCPLTTICHDHSGKSTVPSL